MNSFHRLLLLFWSVCVLSGCDSPDNKTSHRRGKPGRAATEDTEFLRPDLFSSSPGKIDGCVGLYTYDSLNIPFDSLDVDKGKKILVTVPTDFAFFRLHRKDVYLHFDPAKSGPVDKETFKEVYRGNEYTVVLILRKVGVEGETQVLAGTLEIIQGDKHFRIKVKGLSGC
jgi:hypothetical protein